ncbi:hypothetical protein HZB78_05010 [Candidatus Collierbacteria bacterium]|nr:hypothetical protein [Candidatus Collierbacteria bacterium]
MGRTAAVAVESAFTPLGLNLSLGMDGMVGSLLNEAGTSNQLSGINRKGRSPITPEEAVLIQQYLGIQEKNPLAADRSVLDSSRTVLDIIGADTSHPAVIYQAEPDDFKFHPKERYQNRPGSRWIIPVERFGEALPVPDADNLVDLVVNDFNTAVLDMVTIGAMPLVGAGNIIKSIEPAFRILVSKARKGKKISLSDELKTLYENIADQSVMEASPVLSKTLLGMTALTVAFSPIASTLNLKDIKAFGKAANDGLELGHGFSLTPTPDGKPPHVPRWAYLIPGGMMLWGILSACNEATKRPPAVSVSTATHEPTRLAPTEIPKTATFAPTPSATPELALTPSNGSGGPEFIPGSAADLQKLIDLKNFNPATGIDIYKDDGTYTKEYSDAKSALQNQGANVDALEKALKEILKPGQSLKLLIVVQKYVYRPMGGSPECHPPWIFAG